MKLLIVFSLSAVAGVLFLRRRQKKGSKSKVKETTCMGFEACQSMFMQPSKCPSCIETIVVNDQRLSFFPPLITTLSQSLRTLNLSGCSITAIPWSISSLKHLRFLSIAKNKDLKVLPSELFTLSALEHLDVGGHKLEALPDQFSGLQSLRLLNCMDCGLKSLPESIGSLPSLRLLGLKSNQLSSLPPSFSSLTSLVELFITNNVLESFPDGFGRLLSLVKLQASFNKLTSIPEEIGLLPNLEMMRVAVCNISTLPDSITNPSSSSSQKWKKLAWFSLAGNPACASGAPPTHSNVAHVSSEDLKMDVSGKLGDGASGEVFTAVFESQTCAVKVFISDVSPDGQVIDEVDISSSVVHTNITRVIGHVAPKDGNASKVPSALVLDLCKGTPLAKKPTSKHLLRCRWDESITYPVGKSVKIAQGTASALSYLHSRSIAHGDVYAHNLLVDEEGKATLCDFGAAFSYHPSQRWFWERMEVRAYGLFLQDLVIQTNDALGNGHLKLQLSTLKSVAEKCLSSDDRPSFDEIEALIKFS